MDNDLFFWAKSVRFVNNYKHPSIYKYPHQQ